jgi:hypothetical protein
LIRAGRLPAVPVALVSIVGGVLLGVADLLLQKSLPYPWANLANSSAVWAVLAFALGYRVRGPWWRSSLAGVVLLVLAVPSYYLATTLIQDDDLANVWSATSLLWMSFGVVAGALFGAAGSWARASGWLRVVGIAMSGAVLFAEGILVFSGRRATAIIEFVLGVLVILVVARGVRQRLGALALAVPLGLVGFLAFMIGGFSR